MKKFHFDIFIRNKQSKMKRIIKEEDLADEYTAKELAPLLNVSERQVHYYREVGQLGYEHRNRCRYIHKKKHVTDFIENLNGIFYEAK